MIQEIPTVLLLDREALPQYCQLLTISKWSTENSRVFLVNVTAHLVKISPAFKKHEYSTPYLERPPVARILSHINPVHVDLPYFCMIHFNNTFTHSRRSFKFSFSFGFTKRNFAWIPLFLIRTTFTKLQFLGFDNHNNKLLRSTNHETPGLSFFSNLLYFPPP
jgi:hypothetical protein